MTNNIFSVMRLGKKKEKERETESRREVVDGVSRLLGSAKNQPFRGKAKAEGLISLLVCSVVCLKLMICFFTCMFGC